MLPNAVLPPSLDHNYAQWQEREENNRTEQPPLMKKIIPAPKPKGPGEPDSPTPLHPPTPPISSKETGRSTVGPTPGALRSTPPSSKGRAVLVLKDFGDLCDPRSFRGCYVRDVSELSSGTDVHLCCFPPAHGLCGGCLALLCKLPVENSGLLVGASLPFYPLLTIFADEFLPPCLSRINSVLSFKALTEAERIVLN